MHLLFSDVRYINVNSLNLLLFSF